MKTKAGAILSSIQIDRSLDRKISVQLYMGLRDTILSGGLKGGERLPATRTLANEVGVSRTTAIDAVSRLVSEGLLESRIGAGTYVSQTMTGQEQTPTKTKMEDVVQPMRLSSATEKAVNLFADRQRLPHQSQAFVTALPALNSFPMAQWSRLSARQWRSERDQGMGYGDPQGFSRLRSAIASHLNASRGIQCNPEQVFIVNGAQHAFSIIGNMLINPGEKIWFENPGAIGARNAFISHGANLVPVNVDDDGLDVADGEAKAPDFALAFVTPSHQQPLGRIMSLSRRLRLLDTAEKADALIVEDDYDGDFYFGHQPLPTLKSIDTRNRVIYVGTFSKTLFPSLRLGFLISPPNMVDTMSTLFSCAMSGIPTWSQAVVADFIEEGHFATHIRTMRQYYRKQHEVLHNYSTMVESYMHIEKASAGFHTVGFFHEPTDEEAFVAEAAKMGVTLSPISRYCLESVERNGVVIGYGAAEEGDLKRGMTVLKHLFERKIGMP